jgi:hypothetical protein
MADLFRKAIRGRLRTLARRSRLEGVEICRYVGNLPPMLLALGDLGNFQDYIY